MVTLDNEGANPAAAFSTDPQVDATGSAVVWRGEQMLAMACHEMRAPLASLQNAARLLRKGDASAAMREQIQAVIERQLRHLSQLVDDIMEVSQAPNGRLQIRLCRQRIDLCEVVRRAVQTMTPAIEACRHRIDVVWPATPAWTSADPDRLEQVFINLISNAVKYSDHGGRITVSIETQSREIVVAVRDAGIGMPPQVLPLIFEPFVRADDKASGRSGLGLGLAIVRSLVELHGGTVAAASAGRGRGSEFTICLQRID